MIRKAVAENSMKTRCSPAADHEPVLESPFMRYESRILGLKTWDPGVANGRGK